MIIIFKKKTKLFMIFVANFCATATVILLLYLFSYSLSEASLPLWSRRNKHHRHEISRKGKNKERKNIFKKKKSRTFPSRRNGTRDDKNVQCYDNCIDFCIVKSFVFGLILQFPLQQHTHTNTNTDNFSGHDDIRSRCLLT